MAVYPGHIQDGARVGGGSALVNRPALQNADADTAPIGDPTYKMNENNEAFPCVFNFGVMREPAWEAKELRK